MAKKPKSITECVDTEVFDQAVEQDELSKKEMEKVMKERSKDAIQKKFVLKKTNNMGLVEEFLTNEGFELSENTYSKDFADRKEMGKVISKLKENNANFTVSRSTKDGMRYTLKSLKESRKLNEEIDEKVKQCAEEVAKRLSELATDYVGFDKYESILEDVFNEIEPFEDWSTWQDNGKDIQEWNEKFAKFDEDVRTALNYLGWETNFTTGDLMVDVDVESGSIYVKDNNNGTKEYYEIENVDPDSWEVSYKHTIKDEGTEDMEAFRGMIAGFELTDSIEESLKESFTKEEQETYNIDKDGNEIGGKDHYVHCACCKEAFPESSCEKNDKGYVCPNCKGDKLIKEEYQEVPFKNIGKMGDILYDCFTDETVQRTADYLHTWRTDKGYHQTYPEICHSRDLWLNNPGKEGYPEDPNETKKMAKEDLDNFYSHLKERVNQMLEEGYESALKYIDEKVEKIYKNLDVYNKVARKDESLKESVSPEYVKLKDEFKGIDNKKDANKWLQKVKKANITIEETEELIKFYNDTFKNESLDETMNDRYNKDYKQAKRDIESAIKKGRNKDGYYQVPGLHLPDDISDFHHALFDMGYIDAGFHKGEHWDEGYYAFDDREGAINKSVSYICKVIDDKIKTSGKYEMIKLADKDTDMDVRNGWLQYCKDKGYNVSVSEDGKKYIITKGSSEDTETIDEASSSFKKSVNNGGQDTQDYLDGKAIAKVKDPNERARLVATKRLEKSGKLGDRPTVATELKRKVDQTVPDYEKKAAKYAMKKDMTEGFNEDDYDVVKEFGHTSVCVNKNDKDDVRVHMGGHWYVKPEIAEVIAGYYEKKGVEEGDLYYKDYKETKDAVEYAKQLQSNRDITKNLPVDYEEDTLETLCDETGCEIKNIKDVLAKYGLEYDTPYSVKYKDGKTYNDTLKDVLSIGGKNDVHLVKLGNGHYGIEQDNEVVEILGDAQLEESKNLKEWGTSYKAFPIRKYESLETGEDMEKKDVRKLNEGHEVADYNGYYFDFDEDKIDDILENGLDTYAGQDIITITDENDNEIGTAKSYADARAFIDKYIEDHKDKGDKHVEDHKDLGGCEFDDYIIYDFDDGGFEYPKSKGLNELLDSDGGCCTFYKTKDPKEEDYWSFWWNDISLLHDASKYAPKLSDDECKAIEKRVGDDVEGFTCIIDVYEHGNKLDVEVESTTVGGIRENKSFDANTVTGKELWDYFNEATHRCCDNADFYKQEQVKEDSEHKKSVDESIDPFKKLTSISYYKPWGGAVGFYNEIVDANKLDDLVFVLSDIYPDGVTYGQLNDLLWFEKDWVRNALRMDGYVAEDDTDDIDERFLK